MTLLRTPRPLLRCLALAALTSQLAVAQSATLPADLQARYDTLRQAYLTGDLQTLRSLYAPDAALLDVNLGGRPIFPVADALKARGVPFAFASGYGEAGLTEDHRGSTVLQKPFREADLRRVLEGLVAQLA